MKKVVNMAKHKERKYFSAKIARRSSGYMKSSRGTKKKSQLKRKIAMKRSMRGSRNSRGAIGGKRSTLAYCVRCRRKTASSDQEKVRLRNNTCALKGNCGLCHTPKYMIISKAEMASNRIWTNAERRQQRLVR